MSHSSQRATCVSCLWIATLVWAVAPAAWNSVDAQELVLPGEYSVESEGEAEVIGTPEEHGSPGEFGNLGMYEECIDGCPPMGTSGGGSFFSPSLNAHLRARYSTQSYGQGEGNFDLGTMRLFDLGNGAAFFDGQVTMNDVDGVGYNVGGGVRWLLDQPYWIDPDPMRIVGLSLWSDGSSTANDNFFTQLGISLEALGDTWDLRVNGYLPLGDQSEDGTFTPTGNSIFVGNGLAEETAALRESALTVGEIELARRIGNRDAWAFGGAYGMASDEIENTTGWRAGLRGYAFNDLLLQIAVTDDEVFDTNTVFSMIWFIGRTRSTDCLTCSLSDRLREPVLRNDYVAVARTTAFDSIPVNDTQGEPFQFVHVDSSAPVGGDGTFESPFNALSSVNFNSEEGDTIFIHGGSSFTDQSLDLQSNQQLLGEGGGVTFEVTTAELGTVTLPETSPGAGSGPIPRIRQNGAGTSVFLASNNTVDNLRLVGGTNAIDGTNQTENPTLQNLEVVGTMGDGITLRAFAREEMDPDMTVIDFDVTIDQVSFDSVGGHDIAIDADSGVDPDMPNTVLNETINISNITSTGGTGDGINLTNTHTGQVTTITDTSFAGNQSGLDVSSSAGSVDINNMTVTGATGPGVSMVPSTDAEALDFRMRFSNITSTTNSAFVFSSNYTDSDDIRFQLSDNSFTNNSNANPTVNINTNGAEVLNATVQTNTLVNDGTAFEYDMTSSGALGGIRLNLMGNTADDGAGTFNLTENGGDFSVEDQFNVSNDNDGTVLQNGAINIDAGNIPLPFPNVP